MKTASLLITASLAANAALFGALAWQPSLAPPTFRDFFKRNFHATGVSAATTATTGPEAAKAAAPAQVWSSLTTDDMPSLIARLRAAGFPPNVIRSIVSTQVSKRYSARLAALMEPEANAPYWKVSASLYGNDPKRQEEINQIQRERSKALRELLTDDFFATGDVTADQRRRFGNLSRTKIDALQRIEDDYNEMMSQVRSAMGGVTLPEDRAKLELLAREKQADLAAMLAPDELADYTMRTSQITQLLRTRLDAFNPSEAEYRAIFQMQLDLNEKFPPMMSGGVISSNPDFQTRQAVQKELEAQLKASLGDARYAEYSRSTSNEYQQLARLAQRDNLPTETAVQAFNIRDKVAAESNRIFDDRSLNVEQKRAALQTLAQTTRNELLSTLGPTSGPGYVKIADQWLKNVESGSAVTFGGTGGGMITMTSGSGGLPVSVSLGNSNPSFKRLSPTNPVPRP